MNNSSLWVLQLIILSCPTWSPEESEIGTYMMTFFGEVVGRWRGDESRGQARSLGRMAPESGLAQRVARKPMLYTEDQQRHIHSLTY